MTTRHHDTKAATGGAVLRRRVTEAITDAVFTELAESGYARLSMEAVARRAGVGKAALYRRWPSKQAMITELIHEKVAGSLPRTPATGALRSDLRELLATFRGQLADPLLARIGTELLAESRHDSVLAEVLRTEVSTPRREAARAILRDAIDRGELPSALDLELGVDLLIAPLVFRVLLMQGREDDDYLETLTAATEAALKAATPPA